MLAYSHFLTDAKTCAYLRDRPSRLEVVLMSRITPREHEILLDRGVRHFGRSYFRAACAGCRECVSVRVPVAKFQPSRSQRRVLAKNRDVELEVGEPKVDDERMDLHRRFHAERAQRRGWDASEIDREEYISTFIENAVQVLEFRYRLAGRLIAIAYVDDCPGAYNSIFGFWDPAFPRRSLGTFDVLQEIAEASRRGKEHLYLGYHVRGCKSLEYKTSFRPHELLLDGKWVLRWKDEAPVPSAEESL
ncbi:MAG TPA: arginyltransferase [Planctomycetota bacterium]|jgi:arginyl-tRNA--protein-N-Asp/Glu arginylyltransferase|nr:arginyltransferase [Planctomycetota bacterium]